MQRKILVSQICNDLKLIYCGNDIEINGLNLCNRESLHDCIITYVTNENYVDIVEANAAVRVIVLNEENKAAYSSIHSKKYTFILAEEPEKTFYKIHDYLYNKTDFYEKFDFPTVIGEASSIHSSAIIEDGVRIGKSVVIGANTVIRKGTIIEDDCCVGCNTTIGSEGFQIINIGGKNHKIIHSGGLVIHAGSCIGDNVTVCNSLFEDTAHIGYNVMIDNHAYIGHNVLIGDNAVITAGTVLCGSSIVENGAWIGVNSSVLNRVTVGSNSKVGIGSVVTRDIPPGTLAYGVPAKVKK